MMRDFHTTNSCGFTVLTESFFPVYAVSCISCQVLFHIHLILPEREKERGSKREREALSPSHLKTSKNIFMIFTLAILFLPYHVLCLIPLPYKTFLSLSCTLNSNPTILSLSSLVFKLQPRSNL